MPRTPTATRRKTPPSRKKAAAGKKQAARGKAAPKGCGAGATAGTEVLHLDLISTAARQAKELGREMRQAGGKEFSRTASLILQKAAFEWALDHLNNGTFKLNNPAFVQLWTRVHQVITGGTASSDKHKLTEARLKSTNLQNQVLQSKLKKATDTIDTLSKPDSAGLSLAARNAIRREQGLPPLETEDFKTEDTRPESDDDRRMDNDQIPNGDTPSLAA